MLSIGVLLRFLKQTVPHSQWFARAHMTFRIRLFGDTSIPGRGLSYFCQKIGPISSSSSWAFLKLSSPRFPFTDHAHKLFHPFVVFVFFIWTSDTASVVTMSTWTMLHFEVIPFSLDFLRQLGAQLGFSTAVTGSTFAGFLFRPLLSSL